MYKCWPSEDKNWSKVLAELPDWFNDKLWNKCRAKLTGLIGQEENASQRIHEFVFIHLVKEMNLLTEIDQEKYESILDMFETDKVIFGTRFYMKLCQEFNWKNNFIHLVIDHKNSLKIIEIILKDCGEQSYFCKNELTILSLISQSDFTSRIDKFGFKIVGQSNIEMLKKSLNMLTNDKSQDTWQLRKQILIDTFFDPFNVYDLIINQAVIVNKAQVNFYAQLLCSTLKSVSICPVKLNDIFFEQQNQVNFLIKLIAKKANQITTHETVNSFKSLIEEIQKQETSVLPLDKLFIALVLDENATKECLSNKVLLIKHVISISSDNQWDDLKHDPLPSLCYLVQLIDAFWCEPCKKQVVIEIVNKVLDKKLVDLKLGTKEQSFIEQFISETINKPKASTHLLYLSYLEVILEEPLSKLFDFMSKCYHDQILLLAAITRDFMWICYTFQNYDIHKRSIQVALEYVIPFLTEHEWDRLFLFLRMYFYNFEVVSLIKTAITSCERNQDNDIRFMINCLTDLVMKVLVEPVKDDDHFETEQDKLCQIYEWKSLFESLAHLDFFAKTLDIRLNLRNALNEIGELLIKWDPDSIKQLKERLMPPMGKDIINIIVAKHKHLFIAPF